MKKEALERALREYGDACFQAGAAHGKPVYRTRLGDVFSGVGLYAYVSETAASLGTFSRWGAVAWALLGVVYAYTVIDACRNSWKAWRS